MPGGAFETLRGLAVDPSDNLWITDSHATGPHVGSLVDKFDSAGNFILQGDGGGRLSYYTEGIAFRDASSQVYAADTDRGHLWVLNPDGSLNANITGGWGSGCCFIWDAVDNSGGTYNGDVYVLSTNGTVTRVDGAGNPVDFTSGPNEGTATLTGADAPAGTFYSPHGIATDAFGNVYVVDYGHNVIDEFAPSGVFVKEFNGSEISDEFGPYLSGVAVDPTNGNVLVVDTSNSIVDEFDPSGTFIGQITGTGPTEATPLGRLSGGIAIDSSGFVYLSDESNQVVDVFTPNVILPKIAYGGVTNKGQTSGTLNATADPNEGGAITSCHFEFGTTTSYALGSLPCNPNPASSPPASNFSVPTQVSADLSGLTSQTTYHYRIVVGNANGTRKGADQTYLPQAVTGLTTDAPTEIEPASATLNGSYVGTEEDTHYFYEWGASNSYGNDTAVPPGDDGGTVPGPNRTSLPYPLSGLTPETTYHYRLVASNGAGTSIGGDQKFTTPPAVTDLATGPVSDLVAGSATLIAHYTGVGKDTHYYFQYGKTTAYGQTTDAPPGSDSGSGTGAQEVKASAGGLLPSRVYHYRVVASNEYGTTYGADQTFESAQPNLPTVVATSSSDITPSSAALGAEVRPGFGPTVVRFEYGQTPAYETRSFPSEPLASDDSPHPVTTTITTLAPRTTYHYRVVATNFSGTTYGPDRTFDTSDVPEVTIEDPGPGEVAQTTAVLRAGIRPGFSPTTYHFEYGLTGLYGLRTAESPAPGSDDSAHPVTASIAGLTPSTTYHYRVVATNEFGTKVGPDRTVTTTPVPTVVEGTPSGGCKKGFVKKRGKCVKKSKKGHRHTHHKRGNGRG